MTKKYVKDYQVHQYVNANGRVCTGYDYVGSAYYPVAGKEAVSRLGTVLLAVSAVCWVLWLLPMMFYSEQGALKQYYITVPYILCALPLFHLAVSANGARTATEPMQHRDADILSTRFPAASLSLAILSGIAFAGFWVTVIFRIGVRIYADWIFAACAGFLFAAAVWCFSRRGRLKTETRK